MKELAWQTKKFEELIAIEVYQMLHLRSEVFVVEQDCVYQDIDEKDQDALHILGFHKNELIAYARCFPQGFYFDEAAIGRVVVQEAFRKDGLGFELMQQSIAAVEEVYQTTQIKISAQQHLTKFYNSLGFQEIGEGYLEDGIPHIAMLKSN